MAKLVRVCRSNEEDGKLEKDQIPLVIDGDLRMIMEITHLESLSFEELWDLASFDTFTMKYRNMNVNELAVSFMVTHDEVLSFLSQVVPCVGCRQSVEKLYNHIMKSSQPALQPLHIMQSGVLTIDPVVLKDPWLLHTYLYCRGGKLNEILDSIPKCRRNRRCLLHSLETHKSRTPIGCWVDVWETLSRKCQDEVLTINSDTLLDALENHLRKNRFCTECKRKVLKAFGILTGDIEAEKVKGYCPSLYEGLKPCPLHKHVHVPGDVDFLTVLLEKAEHELSGMRRERHAKSMDAAQEEVLTCLAVFMWERLHHLWQKLRTEEQSWQILFYLGINTLRRNFEVSVEEKQGMSRLEQVVEEIFEEEKVKEVKREQKRQKKRARRKEKCKYGDNASVEISDDCSGNKEGLACHVKNGVIEENSRCDSEEKACENNGKSSSELSLNQEYCDCSDFTVWNGGNRGQHQNCAEKCPPVEIREDCSDPTCDLKKSCFPREDCSEPRSRYQAACDVTQKFCFRKECSCKPGAVCDFCRPRDCRQNGCLDEDDDNHDDEDEHNDFPVDDEEKQLLLSMGWNSAEHCRDNGMLERDVEISKEDIQRFKANKKQLINQRQKLREKLREQFNSLSVNGNLSR